MSSRGDRTQRVVHGAVLSMLNDHGPITKENMDSAVKRIVAQMRAEGNRILQGEDASVIEATEHLRKQLHKLRHGHDLTVDQYDRCRAERDALRAELARYRENPLWNVRAGEDLTTEEAEEFYAS